MLVHRIAEFRAWLRQRDRPQPRDIAAAGGQDHNEDAWLVFVCRAVVLASATPDEATDSSTNHPATPHATEHTANTAFPLTEFMGHAHCRQAERAAVAAALLAAWVAVQPGSGVVLPPSLELVLAVLAALEANAHTMVVDPTADHAEDGGGGEGDEVAAGGTGGVGDRVVGWGLFRTGCVLNHSCASNCDWYLNPMGRFEVRTVTEVPLGTAATICFGPFTGRLADRRAAIEQAHGFRCVCPRCVAEETAITAQKQTKTAGGDREVATATAAAVEGMTGGNPSSARKVGCDLSTNWADMFSGWVAAGLAGLEPESDAAAAAVESQVLPYCRQVERDMRTQLAHVADFSYDVGFYLARVERNLAGLFNNPLDPAVTDAGAGSSGQVARDSPAIALYVVLAASLLRAAASVVFTCRGSRHHPLFVRCLDRLAALKVWEAAQASLGEAPAVNCRR